MKIKRYNVDIYPYDVWVAKKIDTKQLVDKFTFLYGDDTVVPDEEVKLMLNDFNSIAATYKVVNKVNNNIGSLVVINQNININSIVHESFHVTQAIAEHLGFDFVTKGTNEHFAYLLGWVVDCIIKFVKGK